MLSSLTTEQLQAAINVYRSNPYWIPREELNYNLNQSRDWLIAKESAGDGPAILAAAISNELIVRELINILAKARGPHA